MLRIYFTNTLNMLLFITYVILCILNLQLCSIYLKKKKENAKIKLSVLHYLIGQQFMYRQIHKQAVLKLKLL